MYVYKVVEPYYEEGNIVGMSIGASRELFQLYRWKETKWCRNMFVFLDADRAEYYATTYKYAAWACSFSGTPKRVPDRILAAPRYMEEWAKFWEDPEAFQGETTPSYPHTYLVNELTLISKIHYR